MKVRSLVIVILLLLAVIGWQQVRLGERCNTAVAWEKAGKVYRVCGEKETVVFFRE